MNAVIDEDLHRSLSSVLQKLGFTVFDIRNHGLRGQPDNVIFKFAQMKKAVLFTGDLGFANILSIPLGSHSGICILRYPNELPTDQINRDVSKLLTKLESSDYRGNLIILSPGKVRLHKPH